MKVLAVGWNDFTLHVETGGLPASTTERASADVRFHLSRGTRCVVARRIASGIAAPFDAGAYPEQSEAQCTLAAWIACRECPCNLSCAKKDRLGCDAFLRQVTPMALLEAPTSGSPFPQTHPCSVSVSCFLGGCQRLHQLGSPVSATGVSQNRQRRVPVHCESPCRFDRGVAHHSRLAGALEHVGDLTGKYRCTAPCVGTSILDHYRQRITV